MEITINGNVTVNVSNENKEKSQNIGQTPAPIDRTNEVLISNDTSFGELIRILNSSPEVQETAVEEAEMREEKEKEAALRKKLGDDYDLVFEEGSSGHSIKKEGRRPGPVQLRNYTSRVAMKKIGSDALCEVFSNGYAVYDNGDRKTVIWVPDCGTYTYYFTQLRDCEKEYMKEKDALGAEFLMELPWYQALRLTGEDQIEYNLEHPRSRNNVSDVDYEEWISIKPANYWSSGCHFDNPEEAYLKKEAAEERLKPLTDKQKEAYELYYEEGLSLREIGKLKGVDHTTIRERIYSIHNIYKNDREKFFYS